MKTARISIASILFFLSGACQTSQPVAHRTPTPPALQDLTDLDDLRVAFNEAKGMPRVVLLLSPT